MTVHRAIAKPFTFPESYLETHFVEFKQEKRFRHYVFIGWKKKDRQQQKEERSREEDRRGGGNLTESKEFTQNIKGKKETRNKIIRLTPSQSRRIY